MTKAAISSVKAPGKENINLCFGASEMIGNVTHLRSFLRLCVVLNNWWKSSMERCWKVFWSCTHYGMCLCVY